MTFDEKVERVARTLAEYYCGFTYQDTWRSYVDLATFIVSELSDLFDPKPEENH